MLDIVIVVVAILAFCLISFLFCVLMGRVFSYNEWLNGACEVDRLIGLIEEAIDNDLDRAWDLFKEANNLLDTDLWVAPTDERCDEWLGLSDRLDRIGQDLYAQAEVMRS